MTVHDVSKGLVTPVMRGMRLLRYIVEGGSTANLSEVGRLIDVNRVTVMRLLATLEHEGLIEKLPQGGHRIGMAFLTLAASGLGSVDLLSAGQRAVQVLSQTLAVSAYMVIPDGHDLVYVQRQLPEGGLVSHIRVGSRVPLFLTAPGRSMLALYADDEIKRLWKLWRAAGGEGGENVGELDLNALLVQIKRERAQGYAWSYSGYESGINACAAPVKGSNGQAVAALSVVVPDALFDAGSGLRERMQQSVVQAARDLSRLANALGGSMGAQASG